LTISAKEAHEEYPGKCTLNQLLHKYDSTAYQKKILACVHPFIMNDLKNSFSSRNVNFSARSRKTSGFAEVYWTYAAQKTPPFDAEIAEKGYLWMETSLFPAGHR
jgi:hypothetical protein